ncbi:MAG TPA: 2OG-Fe(II) oxygenase [Pseudomonadota bacterium]|nr:2OG-Fe(II) oxygenase [Pseudomonadota bacterium]
MSATGPTPDLHARALAGDAEARYELGRYHAARQEFSRARRYLREAAAQSHAGALTELGLFALFGIGMPPDMPEALRLLGSAEAAGSGEASYQLALMAWVDNDVPYDPDLMAGRLLRAARADFAPALRALALVYGHDAAGDPGAAALSQACLARAATRGDMLAVHLLAHRALRLPDPGSQQRGRGLLALAASMGGTRAAEQLGTDRVEPLRLEAAPMPALTPVALMVPSPGGRIEHCNSPLIETYEDAYSAEECEYIIAQGHPYMERSVTIHPVNAILSETEHRTSSEMAFYTFQEDFGLRWLQSRMLVPLQTPMAQAEYLSLLRYGPGQEYRPHRDYLPPSALRPGVRSAGAGQRVHTVFCYLSDVEAGGETDFPLLGVRIRPARGRVVHFHNLHADGSPDERTLHAGLPVERGAKWLGTMWTRQRRLRDY